MSGPVGTQDVKSLIEQFLNELLLSCPSEDFENNSFKIIPFSYESLEHAFEEEEDQEDWNFTWKKNNFKVSWYKHIGRGMTYSRSISYAEFLKMRSECLASLIVSEE